jgi:hypothetical protein
LLEQGVVGLAFFLHRDFTAAPAVLQVVEDFRQWQAGAGGMKGDAVYGGQAAENQQDFAIRPAEGAFAEALDDVGDQQAIIAGSAQADELFDFLDGLRVAFFAIQGQAELGDVIGV